jgi:hypothetical protein
MNATAAATDIAPLERAIRLLLSLRGPVTVEGIPIICLGAFDIPHHAALSDALERLCVVGLVHQVGDVFELDEEARREFVDGVAPWLRRRLGAAVGDRGDAIFKVAALLSHETSLREADVEISDEVRAETNRLAGAIAEMLGAWGVRAPGVARVVVAEDPLDAERREMLERRSADLQRVHGLLKDVRAPLGIEDGDDIVDGVKALRASFVARDNSIGDVNKLCDAQRRRADKAEASLARSREKRTAVSAELASWKARAEIAEAACEEAHGESETWAGVVDMARDLFDLRHGQDLILAIKALRIRAETAEAQLAALAGKVA